MRPAPLRPGKSSTWSVMRAPAESTSQTTGRLWRSACSVTSHDLLDGARAPRSGLDGWIVGHDAHGTPVDPSDTGDDAVRREVTGRRHRVGEQRVLDEGTLVEKQREAVAYEELVLRRELVATGFEVAGECSLGRLLQLLAVLGHARRMATTAMSSLIGDDAKSRAASMSVLHSTSGSTPGSRRRKPAMRSSPNISSPSRASARPSV